MSATDEPRPISDLVDEGDVVMLMTMIGGDHSSRPLTVAGVTGHRLEFLVDATTDWAEAISTGTATAVHAVVCDARRNTYASLQGAAAVSLDEAEIDRLWNAAAAAFFDGKDDPGLAVLRFDVDAGEYWDAPSGRLGSALAVIKAAVSDDADAAGAHGPVATD